MGVRVHSHTPDRAVKSIDQILDEEPIITDSLLRLTRWMADYYLCGWGQVLNAVVPAGARHRSGMREAAFVEAVPLTELPEPPPATDQKANRGNQTATPAGRCNGTTELARLAQCGTGPIAALVEKAYARLSKQKVDKFVMPEPDAATAAEPLVLSDDQLQVWGKIESVIRTGGFHAFLLHGVTGSGKTEIYLKAIEDVVRQGKEALVLVPEISLTPQTIERFRGRCGEVAVLHSHLGDTERGGHWRRVAAGQVQVVVGARSAVFAPARKLGLIIVDEEHEGTFKQESTPRYHGRDVAVMRAMLENVPIILGSATPSLESWHNAQRGQYTLLEMPTRVMERPLPHVGLIDLRHDGPQIRQEAISPKLEQAMRTALGDGGQVMLLLNRRGYSTHVHCPSCGFVATCQNCDLALTYHRVRTALVCHYCAFEQPPLDRCPMCKLAAIRYQGLGTGKLQSEIERKCPGRVGQRMDSDTMRRPGSHQRVLGAFRNGLIRSVMGTQMIAKGLDFPNVTLVGVVSADVGLHLPDFRAAERPSSCWPRPHGRGPKGGRVLVQTFTPDHPAIALAAARLRIVRPAGTGFRHQHHYPPFQRLAL